MKKELTIINHRFDQAEFLASPHWSERPNAQDVSLLVVHCISLPPRCYDGEAVIDFFLNRLDFNADPYYERLRDLKVSSHLFIRRDGSLIQFVPFDKCAWHAGESSFESRSRCNDFSIGIELEGMDDDIFMAAQYETLSLVTQKLMQAYPRITLNRITGHADIAPGRKTDPGDRFDWSRYLRTLKVG